MKKFSFILISISALFASCSKKKGPAGDGGLGLDYYPAKEGKFVVYEVDSTVYTDLPVDTISYRYRIKEKIADSFTDNEGRPAIRLERYIKKYDPAVAYENMPWQVKEVWMVSSSNISVQVMEANVRYTKLVFPVRGNAAWNGNANNTLGEWLYSIEYFDKAENINGNSLEHVLRVSQKEFRTLISYQSYSEKYARGIGLVQREITDIFSNNIMPGIPVEKRIETGLIYKQTLLTYGYE